jgi:hypothetical protein
LTTSGATTRSFETLLPAEEAMCRVANSSGFVAASARSTVASPWPVIATVLPLCCLSL